MSTPLLTTVPQQVTCYVTYCIIRGVIATIGNSHTIPQDKLNNMIKRIISEKALEKHQFGISE